MSLDPLTTARNKLKAGVPFHDLTTEEQNHLVVATHPDMAGRNLADPLVFIRKFLERTGFDPFTLEPKEQEVLRYVFVEIWEELHYPNEPTLFRYRRDLRLKWKRNGDVEIRPIPKVKKLLPWRVWKLLREYWSEESRKALQELKADKTSATRPSIREKVVYLFSTP